MFKHYHPYEPYIRNDTAKLIMGTLPPPRFCKKELKPEDVDFPYGSCDNLLWKAIDKIFNLDFLYDNSENAVEQRKSFLKENKTGICDIVDHCFREKIDASDLGMKNVVLRDILRYIKNYPNIDTIIFTGGYCKNSPEYFLRQILKQHKIKYENISNEVPKVHQFTFENRTIKTISLTSPSNTANRSIGANKIYKEKKAKDSEYTTFDFRVVQYREVFK